MLPCPVDADRSPNSEDSGWGAEVLGLSLRVLHVLGIKQKELQPLGLLPIILACWEAREREPGVSGSFPTKKPREPWLHRHSFF